VQFAGFHHLVQLPLDADHLIVNRAAVRFDLRLTRPAHKPETATLAFKVRPGPHKTRALKAKGGKFHLQHTFTGAGAVGKYFQNQASPVQKLNAPFLFKIALLHRRYRAIDKNQPHIQGMKPFFQLLHLARPEQQTGLKPCQPYHFRPHNIHVRQSRRQRYRLGQTMFRQAAFAVRFQVGVQHKCPHRNLLRAVHGS